MRCAPHGSIWVALRRQRTAAVERLFSQVGIAFAAKRKRGEADALEDIMFARINLP